MSISRQAIIGYQNHFADGTLSASSSPEGYEKENATDGNTYDHWAPSGAGPHTLTVELAAEAPCDYFAVHGHNLVDTAGTIKLQGSADGVTWTDISGPHTLTTTRPRMWRFGSVTYDWYRVVMTGTASKIAVVNAGAALVLDTGIFVGAEPPQLNAKSEVLNQKSDGGQFIGRSRIRTGVAFNLDLNRLDPDWVRDEWATFAEFAESLPFFFAWRQEDFPLEVMYAWTAGDATASQESAAFMKASLQLEGQG